MPTFPPTNQLTRSSVFSVPGGSDELFLSIATAEGASFSEALADLNEQYAAALARVGASDDTAVFCRIFLSDILNQRSVLLASPLFRRLSASCALSIIEQRPVRSGPLSLLACYVRPSKGLLTKALSRSPLESWREGSCNDWRNDLVVKGRNYALLLTANLTAGDSFNAYAQTRAIFSSLDSTLERQGMSLLDHGIRHWIYVRDLDNHYKDMVRARREHFVARGLTEKTRYLASTGILGMSHTPERIVSLDSLSIGGLQPGQVLRMEALSHLGPTIHYGVTFERGLRVRFGDRSHLYISGTASIDTKGEVVHLGDAAAQTRRAIDNVRALLAAQAATLADLAYVIAYVRNGHDRERVGQVLDEELGGRVPLIFTEAAVCRPTWLMELEGVAIVRDETQFAPFF